MEGMDALFDSMPWDLSDLDALDLLVENTTGSVATGHQGIDEFREHVSGHLLELAAADEESKASAKESFDSVVEEDGEKVLSSVVPLTAQERIGTTPSLGSTGKRTIQKHFGKKAQQRSRERVKQKKGRLLERMEMLQQKVRATTRENTTLARENSLLEKKIRMYQEESSLLKAQLREALLTGPAHPVSPVNLRQDLREHVHALCQVLRAPSGKAPMTSFLARLVSASIDVTIQLVLLSGRCNYYDETSWGPDYEGALSPAQVAALLQLLRNYDSEMQSILTERQELNKQCASTSSVQYTNGQNTAIFSAMLKNNLRKELNCFVGQIPILLREILTPVQAAHLIFSSYPSTVNPIAFAQRFSAQAIQQSPGSDCMTDYSAKILQGKVI
ncbi:hypothetical protein BSKO_06436 [Bryopsis sp. KO-2023]|nr:hypothetical protein BSKO_06436 [Bryopsis sp. KO-2023]